MNINDLRQLNEINGELGFLAGEVEERLEGIENMLNDLINKTSQDEKSSVERVWESHMKSLIIGSKTFRNSIYDMQNAISEFFDEEGYEGE